MDDGSRWEKGQGGREAPIRWGDCAKNLPEEWAGEEGRKALQRFRQLGVMDREVVARCFHAREGVRLAAMALKESFELAFTRVRVGAKKHHVLRKMGETRDALRVIKVTGADF